MDGFQKGVVEKRDLLSLLVLHWLLRGFPLPYRDNDIADEDDIRCDYRRQSRPNRISLARSAFRA